MVMTTTTTEAPAGVFLPRRRRYVVAADLGLLADPTAVAVVERVDGVIDFNSEIARHTATGTVPQQPAIHYDCRHLQRLPLRLPYPDQIARIKNLMQRPPLCGVPADNIPRADLLFDATGVGLPVVQMAKAAGLAPIGVTITGGEDKASYSNSMHHVPKALLVQTLDALLHQAQLRFAKTLPEADAMEMELKDFRRFVSAAGRSTWEARSGQHDDLVLAVAIAVWWANRPKNSARWGWY